MIQLRKKVKDKIPPRLVVGCIFKHKDIKDTVYMMKSFKDGMWYVAWKSDTSFDGSPYLDEKVKEYLKNGTWILL